MKPEMAVTGEIRFDDGTTMLVPQPVKFTLVPNTALREAYLETIPELPSHQEVLKHVHSNPKPTGDPLWARVCAVVGGLVLIGAGVALVAAHSPWPIP